MLQNRAIICAIGEDLKPTPGVAGRIFRAVKDINVEMISQGSSETNISFVVDEADVERAVRMLHAEFFEGDNLPRNESTGFITDVKVVSERNPYMQPQTDSF